MSLVLVVQVVLVVAAVALVAPVLVSVRGSADARRRLARARTASGEVVAVTDVGGQAVPTVRYHVGSERLETTPRTPRPSARYLVAQPVDVRYDPQDPAWMTLEAVPGDARVPGARHAVASGVVAGVLLVAAAFLQLLR
ncbi:DUF3592 domain-containing protein [Cellulomonas shaoxiangyii]|uniref:DUF3592 domain-containing protein n=2 Tax=Cellulomonas shaoxiangyii TaxID=2566013 RepID=A0A4P7SFL0_9CELL|nr:DUF3592 domain-containing protein [Cellulomonas shaoxiangyii]QCB92331.1 hypothetical protein E5225_00925 [Cellulomonas shaoxiangyii]